MLSVMRSQLEPLMPHVQQVQDWVVEHPRLALSSAAALLGATYLASSALKGKKNLPPGPRPLPFIGSRHLLDYSKIHESLLELGKKYGDVFMIYVFSQPFIILNSYSAIKEGLMKHRNLMAGRPFAEDYLAAMNEEVFMGDFSEHWKIAKKSGINGLKKFAGPQSGIEEVMMKEVAFLIDTFRETAGTPDSLRSTLFKATGNIMSSYIYGVYYEDRNDPEFQKVLKSCGDWLAVINKICPWDEFDPPWLVRRNFPKELELFKVTCKNMREHCKNVMKKITVDRENPRSFLEFFMATRDMEPMGGIDGFADTINLYTPDAVDTMSTMLQWAVLYLAYFPDVQKRLQLCIDEVVGGNQYVTIAYRADLGLVESFLHEVQRHSNFTSICFPRTLTRANATFQGYDLPQDAVINANFYAAHMDPEIHPEPEKFKMDRFVDENGKFMKADSVFTFSAGARSCPADSNIRMELYLIIANLAHHFNIAFPPGSAKPELRMQDKYFFKSPQEFQVVFTPRQSRG